MNSQPNFLRIATPAIASLVLIIAVGAIRSVFATPPLAQSDAERFVLKQVQKGFGADLEREFPDEKFPEEKFPDKRKLRASFVAQLLNNRDPLLQVPHGISISHALIADL